ncbi:hypothetical protein [Sulfobacillus harzensis]|uniref:Uncharacterized protein n=1 Tax=Sulfobacillus harzensis TaxID=2729629 RepID=A0A7Y0Q2H3_9FIRM|nr:hypothetical protein [Sulfobacillus harzensis]NMP21916.1 hypothetical protein [Sulfobacillus harzensis]
MDEEQLRLEYWEDTRSDPAYPLWVIFRLIGHQRGLHDDQPYLRHAQTSVADVLKAIETHPSLPTIAKDLAISVDELRASLWYAVWKVEHTPPPPDQDRWNPRVDEAWRSEILQIPDKGAANK